MNIIAINGSPRANHNTGALLKKAVEGAESKGTTVETIHLYKLNYKGCIACMSCKRKGSPSLHSCAVKDELAPALERLLYPYLSYDTSVTEGTYFPKALKTAFIYTMGAPEGALTERLKPMENFISSIFRMPVKTLYSCSDYPFVDDWANYEASDLTDMKNHMDEVFPSQCEAAFLLGVDLVS